jgi:hypothetical protein
LKCGHNPLVGQQICRGIPQFYYVFDCSAHPPIPQAQHREEARERRARIREALWTGGGGGGGGPEGGGRGGSPGGGAEAGDDGELGPGGGDSCLLQIAALFSPQAHIIANNRK